jgi:hypothetical protein
LLEGLVSQAGINSSTLFVSEPGSSNFFFLGSRVEVMTCPVLPVGSEGISFLAVSDCMGAVETG